MASVTTKAKEAKSSSKAPVFAEGLCFKKLFFIFVIGSVFGDFYERILTLVAHFMGGDPFFWERRSAVIYGPFSIIYGIGAVLMVLAFARKKYTWWQILIFGGLICGIFEYLMGLFQQIFTGTSSWDYSDHWLNIGGKTSPYIMLVWGIICLGFIKYLYPLLSSWIEKIPAKIGNYLFWFLLIFLIIDMLLSFSAVVKMNLRHHDMPTLTPYGKFLDTVYPDDRIHKAYPNMIDI
ncbi:putative ABC transporter permease [Candidatus Saccharibacteria bacterium]|nr:putative ABC transporter permease [Candidatus Saccharibacteria bacterium]